MKKEFDRKLSKKYKIREGISQMKQKQENSLVWNDLIKVKDIYTRGRAMILGNGKDIDFWRDVWCGIVPLLTVKFRQPSHEFTFGVA
jgi:hypothetical protein